MKKLKTKQKDLTTMIEIARFAINIAFGASLIALSAIWWAIVGYQTNRQLKAQVEALRNSQNIMVWEMDESCMQQLKSSGIIRLKIEKGGEKHE